MSRAKRCWTTEGEQPTITYRTTCPEAWPKDKIRSKYLIEPEVCGAKDLLFGTAELDPGDRHLLHHHPIRSEFYYVIDGRAKVTVGNEVIDARPGMAIYIESGTTHGIVNDTDRPFVFVWGMTGLPDGVEVDRVWDEDLS